MPALRADTRSRSGFDHAHPWATERFRGPTPRKIPANAMSVSCLRCASVERKSPAKLPLLRGKACPRFTRERSLVRAQPCPSKFLQIGIFLAATRQLNDTGPLATTSSSTRSRDAQVASSSTSGVRTLGPPLPSARSRGSNGFVVADRKRCPWRAPQEWRSRNRGSVTGGRSAPCGIGCRSCR